MNVQGVAQKYGVRIVKLHDIPTEFEGPDRAFGCDPQTKMVFCREMRLARQYPEKVLHEIIHCIVQPPGMKITSVPETRILLQFEYQLAKHLHRTIFKRVVAYQNDTAVDMFDEDGNRFEYFSELREMYRKELWDEGLKLCRQLGLLDSDDKITWRWPDWNKLPNYKEVMTW